MSPLRLPQNAASILERAYDGDAKTSEFDKWLIYTTENAPSDAQELFQSAMSAYNDQALNEPESEWENLGFLKPANQSHADLQSPTLQGILEHHLHMVERQFPDSKPDSKDEQQFYIFGFIALTRPDWKRQGVTAVHCDKDRGKWKVTKCSGIPVDQLGMELTSVSDADEEFDNVRSRYDDSDNDDQDNQGGSAPEGQWQFLVYCTGSSQSKAEQRIPDPRGGPDFHMGEASLVFRKSDLSVEKIQEDFPVTYAKTVRDPTVPSTGGSQRVCKIHPALFVIVEGEDSVSVKLVNLDWDHDVERSDEELRKVGRESQTVIQSCDPGSVVSTLEQLATEN